MVTETDWHEARHQAELIVQRILDLPPIPAQRHKDELKSAVAFLELFPHISTAPAASVAAYFTSSTVAKDLPGAFYEAEAMRDRSRAELAMLATEQPAHPRIAADVADVLR